MERSRLRVDTPREIILLFAALLSLVTATLPDRITKRVETSWSPCCDRMIFSLTPGTLDCWGSFRAYRAVRATASRTLFGRLAKSLMFGSNVMRTAISCSLRVEGSRRRTSTNSSAISPSSSRTTCASLVRVSLASALESSEFARDIDIDEIEDVGRKVEVRGRDDPSEPALILPFVDHPQHCEAEAGPRAEVVCGHASARSAAF